MTPLTVGSLFSGIGGLGGERPRGTMDRQPSEPGTAPTVRALVPTFEEVGTMSDSTRVGGAY